MRSSLAILGLIISCSHAWAAFQPLAIEISPDHPLFVFQVADGSRRDPAGYAEALIDAWSELPDDLKPFSTLLADLPGSDAATDQDAYAKLLDTLERAGIPTTLRIADADPRRLHPLELTEDLVSTFSCVKGLQATGLAFEEYHALQDGDASGIPPHVDWLIGAIDLAARYGRFISIELGELRWPRIMSHLYCRPLYEKLRECRGYVLPVAPYGPAHNIARLTSLMGLWIEGAADQWGVASTSQWYAEARLVEPGVFGLPQRPDPMPAPLYRAMILNGAMTGATVYSFGPGSDLWSGAARHYWDEAIYPTLKELIARGLIARKDLVKKKAQAAYQLGLSRTPQDFHLNLRDIDGVFDEGFLIHGAYGMERPGQVPELVPNSGRHYWVPILSAYAPQDTLDSFAAVVQPGVLSSASAWTELLDRFYTADGAGAAFVSRLGRAIFVMHTRENLYEEQAFRIPRRPTPVRGIEARRHEDDIILTWPLREGDVAFKVHRRILPQETFSLIAEDIDDRRYLDADMDPDVTAAYTVTALTNEQGPYEGTVNYGDYLVFSVVESPIGEEVVLDPFVPFAGSRPIEKPEDTRPRNQVWWPTLEGISEEEIPVANTIAARIEAWDQAVVHEDLEGVLELYTADYEDPQGWGFQYVRRAYQWFFERYSACRMDRQVRRWDFSGLESAGHVRVLLYCRLTGVAISDPTGRFADGVAYFPRTREGEVWLTFTEREGVWRIADTNPALPNFKDLLSFSAGPYDALRPGPDLYSP